MNAFEITPELQALSLDGERINSDMVQLGHKEWQLGAIASRNIIWRLEETILTLQRENAALKRKNQTAAAMLKTPPSAPIHGLRTTPAPNRILNPRNA